MSQSQSKNTRVKAPQKPLVNLPNRPNIPQFNKPFQNNLPKFSNNFRINQNRGSGGK